MSFLNITERPLTDTAGRFPVEWWLAYTDNGRRHWWDWFLDKRFRHVVALRRDGRVWVTFSPHGEFLDVEIVRSDHTPWQLVPGAIIQRVVAMRRDGAIRSKFFVGPITCTEHVKALLGIRAWRIRTPRQLFNYCHSHLAPARPMS